jgi:Fe-S-cluster containining protein
MIAVLNKISALPGIADVPQEKRLPRGLQALVSQLHREYDAYADIVRRHLPLVEARRPGEPGGCAACYVAPLGVHAVEAAQIYRKARTWPDFPQVAKRLGELGEAQFKAILGGHTGKDPEKIRMTSKAVREGRLAFARTRQACPFLDEGKQRCRIWDERPIVCRMHHPTTDPTWSDPTSERFPGEVKAYNVRPPLRVQALLANLDKRSGLGLSPFLYAAILQLVQLAGGDMLYEVGEAPLRREQDGRIAERANRNRATAKKFKKRKK